MNYRFIRLFVALTIFLTAFAGNYLPSFAFVPRPASGLDSPVRAAYPCASQSEIPQAECEALVALFNSTNGSSWTDHTGWLLTASPCSWFGVNCNLGHVYNLYLGDNHLTGIIPPELGNLSAPNFLSLSGNQLTGNIPPELGNLTALRSLSISGNQLTGTIPPELGNLTALRSLSISVNQLTGSIPPELGGLTALSYLDLSYNQLTGSIPPELGGLTALQILYLQNNQLSGSIPPELGGLTALQILYLQNNQLSGAIPAEVGGMTALTSLWLFNNQFSGSLPFGLGSLAALRQIFLDNNQLSGNIPPELGNLTALVSLSLNNNHLTGSIPPELGSLTALSYLDLSYNQLTGSIPPELGSLTAMTTLNLSYNQLSGSIPLAFTNLAQLDWAGFVATYLCEPSDSAFQTWKMTVTTWSGTGGICAGPKPWLLMAYLVGDQTGEGYDLSSDVLENIQTLQNTNNPNIHVAVFEDRNGTPANYIGVSSNEIKTVPQVELNSGDSQTLIDFIAWAKATYPAAHTALVIFDHGNALSGVAFDDASSGDHLSPPELKQALSSAGKVDVLYMDTCLMANLEAEYQLRGLADYYVGSENENWTVDVFKGYLPNITAATTSRQLAIQMAESYYRILEPLKDRPSNISVVDMSKIDNVAAKTGALADAIRANWFTTSFFVWGVANADGLQRFDDSGNLAIDNQDVLVDLYDFAWLLKDEPQLTAAADEVISALGEYVVYNQAWSGSFIFKDNKPHTYFLNDSHGVSIGLPRNRISYYKSIWLDFAEGADWIISLPSPQAAPRPSAAGLGWGPFISDLVKQYNPNAPDSPNPPALVSPLAIPGYDVFIPLVKR